VRFASLALQAIAATLVLASVTNASGAATPASFSVPFHAGRDRLVLLDAEIDGIHQVRTLLDTGDAAPYAVVIGTALSARAGARPTGGSWTSWTHVGAAPVVFRSIALRSFAIGSLRLKRPSAADSPAVETASGVGSRRFDAVIGAEFLREHRVSIDYARARVTFDGAVPPELPLRFVLAPRRPVAIVWVSVNGRGPFAFVLDTGAAVTIVSTSAARRAGLPLGRAVALYGAGGRTRGVRSVAREISAGHARRRSLKLIVADVLGAASAEAGMSLDGVLGAPFFAGGTLTIDYPRRAVWIDAGRDGTKAP
jgi:predicted aspartyl protease